MTDTEGCDHHWAPWDGVGRTDALRRDCLICGQEELRPIAPMLRNGTAAADRVERRRKVRRRRTE